MEEVSHNKRSGRTVRQALAAVVAQEAAICCCSRKRSVDSVKRLWSWKAACIVLAAVIVMLCTHMLCTHMLASGKDTYTVRLYRTYWDAAKGYEVRHSIVPKSVAGYASGSHDAEAERVYFDGAEVRCGSGYGPRSLQGSFAAAEVNELYGREVLQADWVFSISAFKTSDKGGFDFRLAVDLPEEPDGEATATLMVFYAGHPAPDVYTWSGAVGERIAFGIEV